MNARREILTLLQELISEHLGIRPERITEQSTWMQLGADSLDRLHMSLAIEDAFKVDIPHLVGERLNTVGQTIDHVLALVLLRTKRMQAPFNLNIVGRGL